MSVVCSAGLYNSEDPAQHLHQAKKPVFKNGLFSAYHHPYRTVSLYR